MKILKSINWPITLCSIFLLSVGILVIYSSSKELAFQQVMFGMFGFLIFLLVSQFDYRSTQSFILPFYITTIILLLAVLILGIETRGVLRWIPLGIINIQPSEFAKPALILLLAKFWTKNYPSWKNILKSLMWTFPFILLIFKQPDLGSLLSILAIWFLMLFASGVSIRKIAILGLLILFVIPFSWLSLVPYQKERIIGFLSPESDPLGKGYNLIQSQIAVGSGQILGRGLGRGTQSRLQFLPEFRTDFIFASIAEEMGFLGSFMIILIYLILFIYCFKVAEKAFDRFGYLTVVGVLAMLLFQTSVNIGVNVGLLPITGITLPLISYGGSSLLATYFSLGLVASVANLRRRE